MGVANSLDVSAELVEMSLLLESSSTSITSNLPICSETLDSVLARPLSSTSGGEVEVGTWMGVVLKPCPSPSLLELVMLSFLKDNSPVLKKKKRKINNRQLFELVMAQGLTLQYFTAKKMGADTSTCSDAGISSQGK